MKEWAKQLDEDAKQSGKKGPLHGLPFSLKENISVAGYDCTIGITKFIGQPVDDDAATVKALKKLGAIPFCKTNIPQTMLRCFFDVWTFIKPFYGIKLCMTASGAATQSGD